MARRFAILVLLLPALIAVAPAAPEAPKPEDFVTVQKGTLPVILSAPHGGKKKVPGVPERTGKGVTSFYTVLDTNTAEITESLAAQLEKRLKAKPWVVIARFERKYIDANRSAEQGYESEKARPYYDAYHGALAAACKAVRKKFGRGILLDIHGNAVHPNAICRGTQNLKTVTLLKDRDGMAAVRGKSSILGRMEKLGYKVIPSAADDDATKEEPKFTGGYIVQTYGSHTAFAIDAIQVELGSQFRAKDRCEATAKDLADAVALFYETYLADAKK
jgi:N-formylglutamate amidohydrolase